MKPIKFINNTNTLLENFEELDAPIPELYHGFIYLWKCLPENTYYIGKHKGSKNSKYDGTGSRFSKALRYYGITQFKRVILEYVDDLELLKYREQYWIDRFNAVKSNMFYNMKNSCS